MQSGRELGWGGERAKWGGTGWWKDQFHKRSTLATRSGKGRKENPPTSPLRSFYQPAIAAIKTICRFFQIFLTGQTCKGPRAWRCHQMVIDTRRATNQKSTRKRPPLSLHPHLPNPCLAPWEGWNCRSCRAAKCAVHHEKHVYTAASNHL